jgi:hypothetical protein
VSSDLGIEEQDIRKKLCYASCIQLQRVQTIADACKATGVIPQPP